MPQEGPMPHQKIPVSELRETWGTNHRIQIFIRILNHTRLWIHRRMLRKDLTFTTFWANQAVTSIHIFKPRTDLYPLAQSLKTEASTTFLLHLGSFQAKTLLFRVKAWIQALLSARSKEVISEIRQLSLWFRVQM